MAETTQETTPRDCPVCRGEGELDDRGFALVGQPYLYAITCKACGGTGSKARIEDLDVGPIPLNPGIVRTVALLREHGFETTDSGDGETHAAECDQMTGYVAITTTPEKLIATANAVSRCLFVHGVTIVPMGPSPEEQGGACVHATYDVANGSALVLVEGIHDRMLKVST